MSFKRLGVFGGTFDPIHNGHLIAAAEISKKLNLDKVFFVPTGEPWQKGETTDSKLRLEMTKLAISGYPNFEISAIDIDRAGPTYTRDTLQDFRKLYPDAELTFIAGADAMTEIDSWQYAEDLPKLAKFVAVSRPGYEYVPPKSKGWQGESQITLVEIAAMAVSSTEIRAKVNAGISIQGLVPDSVLKFIEKHELYRENK